MTGWFARLQIRNKLIVLLLATSAVVLAFASAGHLYLQVRSARADAENDLLTQAQLVLDTADAPLAFGDQVALEKVTATLRNSVNILTACLYDEQGNVVPAQRKPGSQD